MEINGVNNPVPQDKPKKGSVGKAIGGVIAGNAVFNAARRVPAMTINPGIMEKMKGISSQLTQDQLEIITNATNKVIDTAGLANKGVGIVRAELANEKNIIEILKKEVGKSKISKLMPQILKDIFAGNQANAVVSGNNAFYASVSKKIVIPQKGLNLAVFHEAGHAMNANLSIIGSILQKSRGASILALPILAIGLFKNKKAEGEKPKNFIDKATDFVKNNAGKLAFATMLPTVIEEGLASFKGHKLAKKLLSPNLVKKVDKSNLLGLATYALLAIGTGIGAHFAVKVRDNIVHGKENKNKPVQESEIKNNGKVKEE